MKTTVWLTTNGMTFVATIDGQGVVIETAPIARRFVGQPFGNLRNWLRKQGGYKGVVLPSDPEAQVLAALELAGAKEISRNP